MENTAAAIGVPNKAEKQALMPHMIMILVSLSSKLKSLAKKSPNDPPTCSAAPSRPAEPPHRCVSNVDIIIRGVTFTGTSTLDCMAVITRLVPVLSASFVSLYIKTIMIPGKWKKKKRKAVSCADVCYIL